MTTTLNTDFVRIWLNGESTDVPLAGFDFGWPPPDTILLDPASMTHTGHTFAEAEQFTTVDQAFTVARVSMSDLDQPTEGVARGAQYVPYTAWAEHHTNQPA